MSAQEFFDVVTVNGLSPVKADAAAYGRYAPRYFVVPAPFGADPAPDERRRFFKQGPDVHEEGVGLKPGLRDHGWFS